MSQLATIHRAARLTRLFRIGIPFTYLSVLYALDAERAIRTWGKLGRMRFAIAVPKIS